MSRVQEILSCRYWMAFDFFLPSPDIPLDGQVVKRLRKGRPGEWFGGWAGETGENRKVPEFLW